MIDVFMIVAAAVIVGAVGCWAVIDYCKEKKAMRDEEEKDGDEE